MFFGRKGSSEKVKPEALTSLLNSSFDRKLGPLRSRTAGIAKELHSARSQFIRTCEEFERLDAEPNTENLYFANTSFIKSQKGPYAQTLRRLAEELVLKPEGASNAYEECAAMTSNIEEMLNQVLKANAAFKQVVMCYSNHLSNFKRSFSAIERLAKDARGELDKRSDAFSDYKAVKEAISRYDRDGEELLSMHKGMEAFRKLTGSGKGGDSDGERRASEELTARRAELTKAKEDMSALHGRIAALTSPLDRAAKKFDHVSAEKRQLHPFIEDPVGASSEEADYRDFMALVKKLEASAESGAVDVKNRAEVVASASELLRSDLRSKILDAKALASKRSELEKVVRGLEMALDGFEGERISSGRRARDLEGLERRVKELEIERESAKGAIERLFRDYYGVALLIE